MRSNAKPAMAQPPEGFSFVVPSEFVDLPSGGQYYPEGHPLHGKDILEFKHMTAKEEDILTSRTLIKKGIAIDRLIHNVIVDKSIDPDSLLVGDRNALIISLRSVSYGNMYQTNVTCPSCQTTTPYSFDLNSANVYRGEDEEELGVVYKGENFFEVELPITKLKIVFRLLTGKQEKRFLKSIEGKKETDTFITQHIFSMLVSANGNDSLEVRQYVSQNLPSIDSRFLRSIYKKINPNIDLTQDFECSNCGYEVEMEVPLSADFFWPNT